MTECYARGAEKVSKIDELIEGIEEVQFSRGGVVRASEAHREDLSGDTINPLAESAKLLVDVVKNRADQTAKADAGKPRLTLVPLQILFDIAKVREYAVNTKYKDPDNWKKVEVERYRDAMFRHLVAYIQDPHGVDEESGLSHLAHLATNVAFLCELEKEALSEK